MDSPRRHVFVQRASERGLATEDRRLDTLEAAQGTVEEAAYIARAVHARRATPEDVQFVRPFGRRGEDALGLIDRATAVLDGHDDPIGSVRRVEGTVVCLEPRQRGDRVVLRDVWVETPPVLRVIEALDFGVLPDNGPPVAVCCAMAPLVLAPPVTRELSAALAEMGPDARAAAGGSVGARGATRVACLQLEEGDRVEVVGVVCDASASVKRFDVTGRSAPYRGVSSAVDLIVGDEPGTRLIVHRLGPARGEDDEGALAADRAAPAALPARGRERPTLARRGALVAALAAVGALAVGGLASGVAGLAAIATVAWMVAAGCATAGGILWVLSRRAAAARRRLP